MRRANAYVCDDIADASHQHKYVLERLDDYLDQELTPAEARAVMEHLDGCMTCAARCERAYRELALLREAVQRVSAPPSLMGAISRRLAGKARRAANKTSP